MNTFTDRTIELIRINVWFSIVATILCLIIYYPASKNLLFLAMLIGPINLLFKISPLKVDKFNKWLVSIACVMCLIALLLLWESFDFLSSFPISGLELIRFCFICIGVTFVNTYVNLLKGIKT